MKNASLKLLCFLLSLLSFTACVMDTDFDDLDEIALTPVVELDLVYFTLKANYFGTDLNGNPRFTVSDTTELRFLSDSFSEESLKSADFLFRFKNSIPRDFTVDFQFLNEANEITYSTQTIVSAGSLQNPITTEFVEIVDEPEISQLKLANKLAVNVTVSNPTENIGGELNVRSKATYYLEL